MVTRFFHTCEKQYTPAAIKKMVQEYGTDILIGGDPGWGKTFDTAMAAVASEGAHRHVYLMGPGMEEWSSEEATTIKEHARSIGIDTDSKIWRRRWFGFGWITKCEEQFARYGDFYSAEVDNIDAAIDQPNIKEYLEFLKHMMTFCQNNKIETKLMLKNLNENQLKAIIASSTDFRPFLAPFGMFESGSGKSEMQIALCKSLGIQAVTPSNGLRPTATYGTIAEGIPYAA